MQLIDADKLFWKFENHAWENNTGREEAEDILLRFPAVDAEIVKHGKWIDTREDLYPKCSVCGEMSIDATFTNKGNKGMYCSSCGAKMDLKE